eukprot:UN06116
MSQLIDITVTRTSSGLGCILIYYWNQIPTKRMTNSPILRCETNRRNQKTHVESANMIKESLQTQISRETLFKISHSRQANNHPITFIWFWNIKPKYMHTTRLYTKKSVYDKTDHILRNNGNNVATMDRCCTLNKAVVGPINIFQSGYDVSKHAYVKSTEIFQINLDRAYILNTLKFWLYDGDNRVYKYVIEISKDGLSWQQIANQQNKASWQTVQFDEQFVKHVRFMEGSSTS